MHTRKLTKAEFNATMALQMRNISDVITENHEIWPYVVAVPAEDLDGHAIDDGVDSVYRNGEDLFDHVLVMTHTKNVYLVVVVDLADDSIYGHWLLDLNREYGLSSESEQ